MKKSRIVMLLLAILWAGVIFSFSAQTGEESSQTSKRIVEWTVQTFVPEYDRISFPDQKEILDTVTLIVRKGAHFTEYLIFGGLLWGFYFTYAWGLWKLFLCGWLTGTLYAVTDEFHQMFSDGRAPGLMDVGIDSLGVLCGVLLCCAVWMMKKRWGRKQPAA